MRGLWIGNPHRWMKSPPLWLYLKFVLFFFFYSLLEMLEGIDTAWGVVGRLLYSLEMCFEQQLQKYEADDWHHPHYQMIWIEKQASRWTQGERSRVECFQWSARVKERSWVLSQMKDPLRIILHFIAFLYCILLSTGFTVRKLYYVSILFYYASVFDFPKYKKLYIALCYGRKYFLPWSIRISFPKQTNQMWNRRNLIFLCLCWTCGSDSLQMAKPKKCHWGNVQAFVQICQQLTPI